jgi:hypothetical protein
MPKKDELKEYFRHDYHARNHLKFKALRMDMGLEGMGIYWCLVEMLYEEGGSIERSHFDSIAFDLHIPVEKVKKVVEHFGLFDVNEKSFSSRKVQVRLKERAEKSKKRVKAARKRWDNDKAKNDAIAFQVHYKSNAIIEENRIEQNRIEENIVVAPSAPSKTIETREGEFYNSLVPYADKYGKQIVRDFYNYWTEKNKSGKKMKFEMQRTFEIPKRLATWKKKQEEFAFIGSKRQLAANPNKLQ